MEHLARILLLILAESRPAERLSAGASRMTTTAVLAGAAIVALMAAIACAVAALWIWLVPHIGAAAAALTSAAVLLVVAGLLAALSQARIREKSGVSGAEPKMTSEIEAELQRIFANNKLAVLLAAVIAGLALGAGSRR